MDGQMGRRTYKELNGQMNGQTDGGIAAQSFQSEQFNGKNENNWKQSVGSLYLSFSVSLSLTLSLSCFLLSLTLVALPKAANLSFFLSHSPCTHFFCRATHKHGCNLCADPTDPLRQCCATACPITLPYPLGLPYRANAAAAAALEMRGLPN